MLLEASPAWTRHGWPRSCSRVAFSAGLFTLVGGLLSLSGWMFDVARLTDWNGSGISTQPNTALSLTFAGAALLALVSGRTKLGAWLAAAPLVIGSATLFEHLSGMDLGIDRWLLVERSWGRRAVAMPGRMGMPASFTLTVIGLGLIAHSRGLRAQRVSNLLALTALPVASLSVVAYFLGADPLFAMPVVTAIAWQTAVMLLAAALGLLACNWRVAPVAVLLEHGGAGDVARRSVPFIVAVPLALAWLRVEGQRNGWYDTAVGTTILVLLLILLACAGLFWSVEALRRREAAMAGLTEKLKEADRRKDEFLATLAHELRNPMAPLANALELMRRDATLGATPQTLVSMMQRQMSLLRRMVDDLLDISRITRGHFDLRRDTIDLRDVVSRAVEIVQDLASQHRHAVSVTLPDAPLCVFGDADRLAQVVGNLLQNACKYTPDGGRIEVHAHRTEREARIVVRDNGVGIPPQLRERVFEMFAQVDTSLERSHGGLGIGLTLVRRIVDKHGGVVIARAPAEGPGSEFVVSLPLSRITQD